MNVHAILGDGGAVARRLPGYEVRPQQLAMAEAIAHAIAARSHLVVEAGTGVGKSLAYLVPAILRAEVPGTNHPARPLPPAGRGHTTGGEGATMGKQSRRKRLRQEGTPRQEFQRYDVFYPSGQWYTATGTFRLVPLDDMLCPTIELREGQILMPDQRAILLTEERRVVYEPARNRDGLHRAIRLWLDDHPGWVAAAFLDDPSRRPRYVAG